VSLTQHITLLYITHITLHIDDVRILLRDETKRKHLTVQSVQPGQ